MPAGRRRPKPGSTTATLSAWPSASARARASSARAWTASGHRPVPVGDQPQHRAAEPLPPL